MSPHASRWRASLSAPVERQAPPGGNNHGALGGSVRPEPRSAPRGAQDARIGGSGLDLGPPSPASQWVGHRAESALGAVPVTALSLLVTFGDPPLVHYPIIGIRD